MQHVRPITRSHNGTRPRRCPIFLPTASGRPRAQLDPAPDAHALALVGHCRAGHRACRGRAALSPRAGNGAVFSRDRRLGGLQPRGQLRVRRNQAAVGAGRAARRAVRHAAAGAAALSHRRHEQPVLDPDRRPGHRLGLGAFGALHRVRGRHGHRHRDAADAIPPAPAQRGRRGLAGAGHLPFRQLGGDRDRGGVSRRLFAPRGAGDAHHVRRAAGDADGARARAEAHRSRRGGGGGGARARHAAGHDQAHQPPSWPRNSTPDRSCARTRC